MQARVADLKHQFEQLFPGKWLVERTRSLPTGLSELDNSVARGITRKRICEWLGPVSSGKTSLLRRAISGWCAQGLNVAYIDTEGKLFAADWAFVEGGKFWIVRPPDKDTVSSGKVVPLVSKKTLLAQEALWSADQFVRCKAFDVVVLDLGSIPPGHLSRVYARLQRALDRSNCALIVVRDVVSAAASGANTRFDFGWGTQIECERGFSGNVTITPRIKCQVSKDGIEQIVEVSIASSVQNRLFTHPQVPDRRAPKRSDRRTARPR